MIVLAAVYIVILSNLCQLIIGHFCHAGHECALKQSIMGLDSIKKITEARDLENKCKRGKAVR